jgi:AraC-like DNA-binding protein
MPYGRTPVARTPALDWDRLELKAAMADWGPEYRPDRSLLLLPLDRYLQGRIGGRVFGLDTSTALWLTPARAYRLRQPHAGQRSMVMALERHGHDPGPCRVGLAQQWRVQQLAQQAAREPGLAVEEGVSSLIDELLGAPRATLGPHPAVERARAFSAEHATRNDDLHVVARAAAASPFHLARLFRRHTGRTLHAYREDLRLVSALQRLRAGEPSLAQLALALGYAHHSHFSAAFKRRFGFAPSQVRRNLTAPAA